MPYNPFDKPVGDALTPDDLNKLIVQQVAEGYFVEYKGEVPANTKIAKSIASLANTYGGWYIVGVKTDGHNVANNICGFDPATCHDPIAKVREVVKAHISPTPVFLAQVVILANKWLVLVVYVPDDQDTPFITSDGRIYRRVHDSSDPVPETDRHAVDRLAERGRERKRDFARFCQDERAFSEAEGKESQAWVGLYLWPYPAGLIEYKSGMASADSIGKLLEQSRTQTEFELTANGVVVFTGKGDAAFTAGYQTHRCIVLRQVDLANVARNTLTVELYFDGRAKILIPLPTAKPVEYNKVANWVKSPQVRQILEEYVASDSRQAAGIRFLRFFDVERFWGIIAILVTFYRDWLGANPLMSEIKVAATLTEVWRCVPFVDDDEWAEQVKKLGMPVVGTSPITIPEDIGRGVMMSYDGNLWMHMCNLLGTALGLSTELLVRAILMLGEKGLTAATADVAKVITSPP